MVKLKKKLQNPPPSINYNTASELASGFTVINILSFILFKFCNSISIKTHLWLHFHSSRATLTLHTMAAPFMHFFKLFILTMNSFSLRVWKGIWRAGRKKTKPFGLTVWQEQEDAELSVAGSDGSTPVLPLSSCSPRAGTAPLRTPCSPGKWEPSALPRKEGLLEKPAPPGIPAF